MIEANDDNFEKEVIKSEIPVVVDFYAPWCVPCKMMSPILDEIEKESEGKIKVVKCNVDECEKTIECYNVMNIPKFMVFKDSLTQSTYVGSTTKDNLMKELNLKKFLK